MPERRVARLLGLLTAVFVLSGAAFALGTPLFQNPDEPTHVDLVHHYVHDPTDLAGPELRQRVGTRAAVAAVGLPDVLDAIAIESISDERPTYQPFDGYPDGDRPATEGCPVSCQSYQYAHPPTWYYLAAPVAWVLDGRPFPATVLALRLVNVALVAPMVLLTWYAARQVWPGSTWRPLVAAAAMAGAGPVVATAAAANNDALVLTLSAATIAVMARVLRAGAQPRLCLLLGLLVGAGLLTKAQFLAIGPMALLALLAAPPAGPRWRALAAFAAPATVGGLWWAENLVRDGSLTRPGSEILVPDRPGPWQDASFVGYALDRVPLLVERFWGSYGWLSVDVPSAWRTVLTAGTIVLGVGWLAGRRWGRPTAAGVRMAVLAAVPVALCLAVFYASFEVHLANGETRGVQARYVYGAAPVLAIGVAGAVGTIVRRLRASGSAGRLFALGAVSTLALGGGASFARAMHGLYATGSIGLWLDRARVVAPSARVALWLGLVGAGWVVVTSAIVHAGWTFAHADPTATHASSDVVDREDRGL